MTLTLETGDGSMLVLPIRPPHEADGVIAFDGPEEPPAYPFTTLRPGVGGRTVSRDLHTGITELRFEWEQGGLWRLDDTGTEIEFTSTALYSITEDDPLTARVDCENGMTLRGDGRDTANRAAATMTSTATEFRVTTALEAFEAGRRVWARSWTHTFPRDHV